jgi:hypothetical protein
VRLLPGKYPGWFGEAQLCHASPKNHVTVFITKIILYILFLTMLTDPGINEDDVSPSRGLFLTFGGEKYAQYYALISTVHSRQYFCERSLNPFLGVVDFRTSCEPSSTLVPC